MGRSTSRIRTQAQLADLAGKTRLTVRRALEGRPGVSEATRKKILKLAKEAGYLPHAGARSMRRKRYNAVALVLSSTFGRSYLPPSLFLSVLNAVEAHGCHLTIARLPDAKLTDEGYVPRILSEYMADGLLVNYNQHIPPRMIELIEQLRYPVVWFNIKHPADAVYVDEHASTAHLTRHVLSLGHRRVAYVQFGRPSGPWQPGHYSELERYEGYEAVMRDAGLAPRRVEGEQRWATLAKAMLEASDRPTAVVVHEDNMALLLYRVAMDMGLRVPEDLSIASIAGPDFVSVPVDLTRIGAVPDWGRPGIDMLFEKIERPEQSLPVHILETKFIAGATCAAPARP